MFNRQLAHPITIIMGLSVSVARRGAGVIQVVTTSFALGHAVITKVSLVKFF